MTLLDGVDPGTSKYSTEILLSVQNIRIFCLNGDVLDIAKKKLYSETRHYTFVQKLNDEFCVVRQSKENARNKNFILRITLEIDSQ